MLTFRGAKRDKTNRFKSERRLDVFDDGQPIGQLVCDLGATKGDLTLHDKSYVVEPAKDDEDTSLGQLLHDKGGSSKSGRPLALKDESGRVLGLAKQVKSRFMIAHGEQTFVLRKASFFSRPYNLYQAEGDTLLGSAGQKSFFGGELHVDVSAEFHTAFRVFILVLSLNLAMQRAAALNNSN